MDVSFFLRERLQFIRQFYSNSAGSFEATKQKIENEEEPFIPNYSEEGEPPFQAEWQQAEDSLQVLGTVCISMLSSSLKLYFTTVDQLYRFEPLSLYRAAFKKGFIRGYAAFYRNELRIDFQNAPCDLPRLEEIVHIRNAFEHPSEIYSQRLSHPSARQESPSMFFCREHELNAWDLIEEKEKEWFCLPPAVHVDLARLTEALDSASRFGDWLENQLTRWRYPGSLPRNESFENRVEG
jgi:hypothetical protein